MLILFIEGILIEAEHPFERLMQGKVVILDVLIEFQLSDASQYSIKKTKKLLWIQVPSFLLLLPKCFYFK